MDDFLRNIRSNRLEKKELPVDDWRLRPLIPLIREGPRDDFKARESSEQNPNNYVVEIFPKPDQNHLEQSPIYRKILTSNVTIPGLVDLRMNEEGKYTIWLGSNHISLMGVAAQIPNDQMISQYIIGIRIHGDKGGNIYVLRESESVRQSCNRTPEQIIKILDAVDITLKNTFKHS